MVTPGILIIYDKESKELHKFTQSEGEAFLKDNVNRLMKLQVFKGSIINVKSDITLNLTEKE